MVYLSDFGIRGWWLLRMSLGVFPPLNLLKHFEKDQYKFFFVYLIEFACYTIWSWAFSSDFLLLLLSTKELMLLICGVGEDS